MIICAVSLPNPEKCDAGKRQNVKRQKVLKSSIPSPFKRRCSHTPGRICHSRRTARGCFLLFGRAVIFGRKDFLPVEPQSALSFLFPRQTKVRLKPLL